MKILNISYFVIGLVALTACSKDHNNAASLAAAPVSVTPSSDKKAAPAVAKDDLVLEENFTKGDELLVINDADSIATNFARIRLVGDEAEKFFKSLRTRDTSYANPDNKSFSTMREGPALECYENLASTDEKYVCNIYLDYEKASARKQSTKLSKISTMEDVEVLKLDAKDAALLATKMKGKQVALANSRSAILGEHVLCVRSENQMVDSCQMLIRKSSGEAYDASLLIKLL